MQTPTHRTIGGLARTALVAWLAVFEALAERFQLRGLRWGPDWRGAPAAVAAWMLYRLARGGGRSTVVLLATLPVALVIQALLAIVRNWDQNPLLRLRPGVYPDREIVRRDILSATGPVPALHVSPSGGARAAVCVAHGSGCDKTFYAWQLVDALIARGIAVLLIDLDGHGESPRPQDFPAIVNNIVGPTAWLRERYARVGVIGMSLGGCVATRAVADGVAVDALAVLESPPRLRLDRQALEYVMRAEISRLAQPEVIGLLRDGSLWHIGFAWRTSGIRAHISTWDLIDRLDLLGGLEHLRTNLEHCPPLLFIYGSNDSIVPLSAAEQVRQALPPAAAFYLVPRASHISLPIDPWAIARVSEWMAEQLADRRDDPA